MTNESRRVKLKIELRTIQAWERVSGGVLTADNRQAQKRRRAEIMLELKSLSCTPKMSGTCPVLQAASKSLKKIVPKP